MSHKTDEDSIVASYVFFIVTIELYEIERLLYGS